MIAETVVHEIAHHFGIDDERLHEIDALLEVMTPTSGDRRAVDARRPRSRAGVQPAGDVPVGAVVVRGDDVLAAAGNAAGAAGGSDGARRDARAP